MGLVIKLNKKIGYLNFFKSNKITKSLQSALNYLIDGISVNDQIRGS